MPERDIMNGRTPSRRLHRGVTQWILAIPLLITVGCHSPDWHRQRADDTASELITATQSNTIGYTENVITNTTNSPAMRLRTRLLLDQNLPGERPSHTNAPLPQLPDPLPISPTDALEMAAMNSRAFQNEKDKLFIAALQLDLEQDAFRSQFNTTMTAALDDDQASSTRGTYTSNENTLTRTFRNGIEWTSQLALDLSRILTGTTASSFGILLDSSISIPLLRGSGRDIIAEPLRQAERDLQYAVMQFERYKRQFAYDILSSYLAVLQSQREITNARSNYESLTQSRQRARKLSDAGRLPEFQADQTVQDELRARSRWINTRERHASQLDELKIKLGLPTDARITLDDQILDQLVTEFTGTNATNHAATIPEQQAVQLALDRRLDLQIAAMQKEDAERKIAVAVDALRAELTLFGQVATGERRSSTAAATQADAELGFDQLRSNLLLTLDLPFNRRAERIAYRQSLLNHQAAIRDFQAREDSIKQEIRNAIRALEQARENLKIQTQAVELAEKRVRSTDLFLEAGRAEIRDSLDAREALINARNALAAAAIRQRLATLQFKRDTALLQLDTDGIFMEPDWGTIFTMTTDPVRKESDEQPTQN